MTDAEREERAIWKRQVERVWVAAPGFRGCYANGFAALDTHRAQCLVEHFITLDALVLA
jgi:hypothetical protein